METTNKILMFFFTSLIIIGCNSKTYPETELFTNKKNIVSEFLRDINSLKSDTNINPIAAFKEMAKDLATEIIVVSKDNIESILIKSRDYSNCVVVTANHTIVKIKSVDDCQQSGSWKVCMPYVEGYIKKGKLDYKKDYMNNVIGTPDRQERVAYFFSSAKTTNSLSESILLDSSKIIQEICFSGLNNDEKSPCNQMDLAIKKIIKLDSVLVVKSSCYCNFPCTVIYLSSHNKKGKLIDISQVFTDCDCPPAELCGWSDIDIISDTKFKITHVTEKRVSKYDSEGYELEFDGDIKREYEYETYEIRTNGKMGLINSSKKKINSNIF